MIRITYSIVALAALLSFSSLTGAQSNSDKSKEIAIEGATLRSATGSTKDVTIVIKKGKITAVGTGIAVPAGATRIDGRGKVVTTGLVATSTRLGMVEVNAVGYTNEGRFGAKHPVHAAFQIVDGYNPNSMVIAVARNGGITSTISAPGGGLVAGQSAWMSMADGSVADNTIKQSTAMHVTLGHRASGLGDGSRGLALQRLRALLDDAQHYSKNRAAYNRGQTRKYGAGHLDLEALSTVLSRKIPMVISVNRKSDIAAVLRLAKNFKIRVVLEGASESWMLAKELADAKIPVILNPKANLPGSFDQVNVVDDLAIRLTKAGVAIIISPSGDASSARTLRQLAGLAVAHGLSWEDAFAAITTTPAKVFEVKRGTLEVGAVADIVVWTGDPLELSSRAEHIIVGGVVQSQENHQTLLLKRYRNRGK